MIRRIIITLEGFLFFCALFLLYAYVVVPRLIGSPGGVFISATRWGSEESTADSGSDEDEDNDSAKNIDLLAPYREYLKILFPGENDWRHSEANLVTPRGGEGLLLFRGEPKLLNNERTVRFNACTIVILDNEPGLEKIEQYRRSLVLETTENITLTFSKPLSNPMAIDFSSFESGELNGQVIIRSDQKSPGPEDDLLVKTRKVSFSTTQILANSDILFQLGKQYGEGEGLTMELSLPYFAKLSDNETDTESLSPLEQMVKEGNLGGGANIKRVELKQLHRLEFSLDSFSLLQNIRGSDSLSDKKNEESTENNKKSTVDIRCKNGLLFAPNNENRSEWIGRFVGEVELLILNEQEKQDSLKCDNLYLYLTDPQLEQLLQQERNSLPPAVQKKMPTGRLMELELRKFKAVRTMEAPASIDAPRYSFHAEGDEIHYDLQKNEVILNTVSAAQRVLLTKDDISITSEGIKYIPGKNNGELGTVLAGKNGTMEAVFTLNEQLQRFRASWGDGLQLLPVPNNPDMIQLQMIGGADFSIDGIGHIRAQEVVVWGKLIDSKKFALTDSGNLFESIKPVGANFRGNVRLTTANGVGTVREEVTIRFQDEADPATMTAETPGGNSSATGGNFALFGEKQDTQFEMEAGKLDLWINIAKEVPEATQLVIRKNVRFWQKNITDPTEAIRIEGEEVQISNPTSTNTAIHLIGNTAHFSGKKLQLTGYQISLDEKNNTFSVLGPGKLTVLSQLKSDVGKVLSNDPIDVVWSREMTFDGKNLYFLANQGEFVTVSQKMSSIRAPEMVVSLKKPVSIFELQTNVGQLEESSFADELDYLECKGTADQRIMVDFCNIGSVGVPDNQSPNAMAQGYYRGEFGNFRLQFPQGDFIGQGPGWIRASVKYEPPPGETADQPAENNSAGLLSGNMGDMLALPWKQLHMVFQESITGNIYNKIVSANRMVNLAFIGTTGQESDLDVTQPERFPTDCVYLNCQKLQLSQMTAAGNKGSLEFLATGNTIFHYNEYLGRAESIKYSDAKNMIYLLGEGRSQASLYKRRPGAEASSLGNFMRASFNLKTQKLEVENYDNTGSSFPVF